VKRATRPTDRPLSTRSERRSDERRESARVENDDDDDARLRTKR